MADRIPSIADMEPDALANLLRNLAHGIEEGDVPVKALETNPNVATDEPLTVELCITYHPPDEMLMPSNRLYNFPE